MRISGTNYAAQTALNRATNSLTESSLRLSTLKRINRGSDDPAGLVAEADIRAELTALNKLLDGSERERQVVRTADSALGQTLELFNRIEANVVTASSDGTSDAERRALQIEIDAAVDAVGRIGNTSFQGRQLFDGSRTVSVEASTDLHGDVGVTLPRLDGATLGGDSGRLHELSSGGAIANPERAQAILRDARDQVLSARAELGAFERQSIDSLQGVMDARVIALSEARSSIGDTDVASESALLVKSQIQARVAIAAFAINADRQSLVAELFS